MYRRPLRNLLLATLLASSIGIATGTTRASGQVTHGIVLLKNCEDPTLIGSPYECAYSVAQNVAGDTATVTSIVDQVDSADGPMSSGNILPDLNLTLSGGATCTINETSCSIPEGGSISTTSDFSFYAVQAVDFTLPDHVVPDQVTATYTEDCSGANAGNCPVGPQTALAGSSTTVQQLSAQMVNSEQLNGYPAGTVLLGSKVTDQVTVSGLGPTPTGTVSFAISSEPCTPPGTPIGTSTLIGGVATSNPELVNLPPQWFLATYSGDGTYASSFSCALLQGFGAPPPVAVLDVERNGKEVTSVPLGSTIMEQAVVTNGGGVPLSGTVGFNFFPDGNCSGTGSQAGIGNLNAGVANSNLSGALAAGVYSILATYIPSEAEATLGCDSFKVRKGSVGLTVRPSKIRGNPNKEIVETATVKGAGVFSPTGTVTFYACPLTTGFHCLSAAQQIGSPVPLTPAPNGTSSASTQFEASSTDRFEILAAYSGDSNYHPRPLSRHFASN